MGHGAQKTWEKRFSSPSWDEVLCRLSVGVGNAPLRRRDLVNFVMLHLLFFRVTTSRPLSLSLSLFVPVHSLFSFSYTPEEESEGEGGKKMVPVVWSSCSGERRFVDRLHEKNRREIEIWLTQRSKRNQTMKHSWTHSCLSTFFRADSLPRSFFLSSLSPKPFPICFVRPNSKRTMWMRPQIQGSEGSGVFCPCPLFLKTTMFLDLQYFHRTLSQLRRVH